MSDTEAVTDTLVDLTDTGYEEIPVSVRSHAKRCLRDVIGVGMYGSHHEIGEKIRRYVHRTAPGSSATLFGGGSASAAGAALANGTFAHAIDFDDTFESIVLHPSAPVFPAALASVETRSASGRDLLRAYIVGVEVAYRLGNALYPDHYEHGWHHTGTIGSFGAAAASATLLELSAEQIRHCFGIVASGSSSLKQNFGSMTKPLHAGHAAQTGVRAAMLAADGFTADTDVFAGPMGYLSVMSPYGEYDVAPIVEGGDEWGVHDIGFKPYPSGVISHAAMEALRQLVIEHDLEPTDVRTVTVTLDDAASEMLIHTSPANELQAKFSIEFCLAAVLLEREVGVTEFTTDYITDETVQETLELVRPEFEPGLFDNAFAGYGARVVVETEDGEEHVREEKQAPGSSSNPLPEERWVRKFDDCVEPVLGDEADQLRAVIEDLETDGGFEQFINKIDHRGTV